MRFFEFIFLSRKWASDRSRIVSMLERAKADCNPMWLLVFPEGTVITENTKSIANSFAKKKDIEFTAQHVILPRSTGLFHILRCLDEAEYLYDFTIAYSGISKTAIPYDEYPIGKIFFEGNGPEAIHIHVDRFKIAHIPGVSREKYNPTEETNPLFEEWLRKRFLEKDQLMSRFYDNGCCFPDAESDSLKQTLEINRHSMDWISISAIIVSSMTSWSWLFL